MRKLIVGLLAVGLLAVAAPAMAQQGESLGLIASGAVIPYFGSGSGALDPGSISFLEVYAPVIGVGDAQGRGGFHMFFFDTNCTRQGESVGLPLSANDVEFLQLTPDFIDGAPVDGLITAASVDITGFTLVPLTAPVQAKVLVFNASANNLRTLEPIALDIADTNNVNFLNNPLIPTQPGIWHGGDLLLWNPLRTSATFYAPNLTGVTTQIYLICPNDNIANITTKTTTTVAFPESAGFPALLPRPQLAGSTTPLRVLIFDDEELLLRDTTFRCNCLTRTQVTGISTVYTSPLLAPRGTYTEIYGATDPPRGPFSFTGYRAITFSTSTGASSGSFFSRLSNGNECFVSGNNTAGCVTQFPAGNNR
jgi:hypothetical protein